MERFVFSAPAAWRAEAPGTYAVGEATLTVSELGALPEYLPGLVEAELGRAVPLESVALASGWPAAAAEIADGEGRRMLLAVEIVDRGVLVRLAGPAASFAAARAEVLAVLGAGTVAWGPPAFLTLAEVLDGVRR